MLAVAGVYLPLTAVLGGLLFVQPEGYQEAERDVIRLSPSITKLEEQVGELFLDDLLCSGGHIDRSGQCPQPSMGHVSSANGLGALSPVSAASRLAACDDAEHRRCAYMQTGFLSCEPSYEMGASSSPLHCAVRVIPAQVIPYSLLPLFSSYSPAWTGAWASWPILAPLCHTGQCLHKRQGYCWSLWGALATSVQAYGETCGGFRFGRVRWSSRSRTRACPCLEWRNASSPRLHRMMMTAVTCISAALHDRNAWRQRIRRGVASHWDVWLSSQGVNSGHLAHISS